jgi:hypothetical protein
VAELSFLEINQRYGALGPDFLTWLLIHADEQDLPESPTEPGLQVSLMGPMLFRSDLGEATKISLSGDEAPAAPEVRAALRQGKRLSRCGLLFTVMDAAYQFVLDAETFDLKSVKLPVPKIPDIDEYMVARIQALQHLTRLVHELFDAFLAVRLDPARWADELASWAKR